MIFNWNFVSTILEICRDSFVSTSLIFFIAWIKPFSLILMYFHIYYNCFVNQLFTIKRRLFARKELVAERNKATLISLWSRGRAISADVGWEFRPLCLVWWALVLLPPLSSHYWFVHLRIRSLSIFINENTQSHNWAYTTLLTTENKPSFVTALGGGVLFYRTPHPQVIKKAYFFSVN